MDYAVIMAGGAGKRLWPLSRQKRPKQVLKLLDGQTLLGRCFDRLRPIFDIRNIIVLTNVNYADVVRENLFELPLNNVIAEPAVRDTTGAIGLVASILTKYDPEATVVVVTADQLINPAEVLQQAIKDALVFINNNPDSMITFGIQPTYPSTLLGYIKCVDARECKNCRNKIYSVKAFKEKPDEKTAKRYLKTDSFAALADVISSDKDNNIVIAEKSEMLNCTNNIVVTEDQGHLIAAIGLDNMVVAHSSDATFICPINQTGRMKELLELIERNAGDKFL
jgi:mannose-1-phosphate guanylyltransferase